MNTARTANSSMPYSPEPTPPKTTSPSSILISGTRPPRGVRLSCTLLTAPQLASVVITVNSAELAMPKRTSLPSMLPPDCVPVAAVAMPSFARFGLPACSDG